MLIAVYDSSLPSPRTVASSITVTRSYVLTKPTTALYSTVVSQICCFSVCFYRHCFNFQTNSTAAFHSMVLVKLELFLCLYSLFVFLNRRLLSWNTVCCASLPVCISVYKYFSQLALLFGGSTSLCFMLLFGTKVSLYFPLTSADGDSFGFVTGWLWCSTGYFSQSFVIFTDFCLVMFYCLISNPNIHFSFQTISYTLIMHWFNIFSFCFMTRKETIN
jgi:hypothetical protein